MTTAKYQIGQRCDTVPKKGTINDIIEDENGMLHYVMVWENIPVDKLPMFASPRFQAMTERRLELDTDIKTHDLAVKLSPMVRMGESVVYPTELTESLLSVFTMTDVTVSNYADRYRAKGYPLPDGHVGARAWLTHRFTLHALIHRNAWLTKGVDQDLSMDFVMA